MHYEVRGRQKMLMAAHPVREEWTEWRFICSFNSEDQAAESAAAWQRMKPDREYRVFLAELARHGP